MNTFIEVKYSHIEQLNPEQLTKLLKCLLECEAQKNKIPLSAICIGENICTPDGGVDAEIKWENELSSTDFLPSQFTIFQVKAKMISQSDCKSEITKSSVIEALSKGATYVLFVNKAYNSSDQNKRLSAMQDELRQFPKIQLNEKQIQIFDASKIASWVNCYLFTTFNVLSWLGLACGGYKIIDELGRYSDYLILFSADAKRQAIIIKLREHLKQPKQCLRLLGLPGIGKTRLAYEIFKSNRDNDEQNNPNVIYRDFQNISPNSLVVIESIAQWIRQKITGVIVLDNLHISQHSVLEKEICRNDSTLSALILSDEIEDTRSESVVLLEPMQKEGITKMLQSSYKDKIPNSDLSEIVDLSDGFPEMAIRLVKMRMEERSDLQEVIDKPLLKRLLWGSEKETDLGFNVISACSLFNKFGLELEINEVRQASTTKEKVENEARFIAKKILNITSFSEFYTCIKTFENRRLIERRGRYARVVPKPLAIRLASQFLDTMDKERQRELIQCGMPDSLFESFCAQISYLSSSPVVKNLVSNFFAPHGFFHQAEVIFSERGSLLFRSCVTANPTVTCEALMRLVEKKSDQEIYAINGSVRRNLINALESLCFREDCFQKAAFILLRFAHQENEVWSNNATNLFEQLFRVILSGTQAPPQRKLEFIDGIINESFAKPHIVSALSEALNTGFRSRAFGAECQGGLITLKEWQPKTYKEILDYQKEAIKRLINFSEQQGDIAEQAKEVVALHIRDLLPYEELIDRLDSAIKKNVKIHGGLWPTALKQVKYALQFDSKELAGLAKTKLQEWQLLLTPCQLSEKLELFVANPIYEYEQDDTGSYVDIAMKNVVTFARECAMDIASLIPHINKLNEKRHALASVFACEIVKTSKQWQPLFDLSVKVLRHNPEADPSFFLGLLNGIFCVNPVTWAKLVKNIAQCSELERYLADILATGEATEKDLSKLLVVLEQHPEWSHTVSRLSGHQSLKKLDIKSICHFVESLSNISKASAWHALDFLYMHMLRFPSKRDSFTRSTSKKLILKLDFSFYTSTGSFLLHHWSDTIKSILSNPSEKQFAKKLMRILLMDVGPYKAACDTLFNTKEIVEILLTKFSKVTWSVFQEMIRKTTFDSRHYFERLLGKELDFSEKRSLTMMERLPMERLVSWCQEEPDFAPQFIARTIEVFHDKNSEVYVSNLADFLLRNFAPANEEVLRAFDHNLFSFSVTGSLVPHYQRELNGWNSYKYSGTRKVKDWIERNISYLERKISEAKSRDEEGEWGVFSL